MFDYLNCLLFEKYEMTKEQETLVAFHKKETNVFAYGIFENCKEERGKTKRIYNVRKPIKIFIIMRESSGNYVYDEFENQDYDFKQFKF